MKKSRALQRLTILLTATQMLVACEHFPLISTPADPPVVIAPSTFCQIYIPIRGPGAPGSPEWSQFWDELQAEYPAQYDAIRKNNVVWQQNCIDVDAGHEA